MSFDFTNPLRPWIYKDPDATLDYSWDWSQWLTEAADTYLSHTIIITGNGGVTMNSSREASGVVTAILTGGVPHKNSKVTCRLTTVGGRIEDRTMVLKVTNR